MLDSKAAMTKFCNLIASEPDIAKVRSFKSVVWACSFNNTTEKQSNLFTLLNRYHCVLIHPNLKSSKPD